MRGVGPSLLLYSPVLECHDRTPATRTERRSRLSACSRCRRSQMRSEAEAQHTRLCDRLSGKTSMPRQQTRPDLRLCILDCRDHRSFQNDPDHGQEWSEVAIRASTDCGKELTASVVPVVEHLNRMNRVSVGLHVPENVAIACKACNNQKRDDEQKLPLADNGWESFLSHDGTRCATRCRTCAYWRRFWPEDSRRLQALAVDRQIRSRNTSVPSHRLTTRV